MASFSVFWTDIGLINMFTPLIRNRQGYLLLAFICDRLILSCCRNVITNSEFPLRMNFRRTDLARVLGMSAVIAVSQAVFRRIGWSILLPIRYKISTWKWGYVRRLLLIFFGIKKTILTWEILFIKNDMTLYIYSPCG